MCMGEKRASVGSPDDVEVPVCTPPGILAGKMVDPVREQVYHSLKCVSLS